MAESAKSRYEAFTAVSVEDIEDSYRRGYINSKERNFLLMEKAHATVDALIGDKGYLGAVWERGIENTQKGWENLKAAAHPQLGATLTEQARHDLYAMGLALWGQVQMLTGFFTAFGEITGQQAEFFARTHGASPGLARVINAAADTATGFLPVGKAAQTFVKGVQTVQGLAKGGKTAGTMAKGAEAASGAAKAAEGQQVAEAALSKGLEVEGITGTVFAAAEKAAAPAATATGQALSVTEQFAADLKTFRRQMDDLTEVQTNKQTQAGADRLGLSVEDLRNVVPGKALTGEETLAYLDALKPLREQAFELAEAAMRGGEAEANAFMRHMSEFFTLAPTFRASSITGGRATQIQNVAKPTMKNMTEIMTGWDPVSIANGNIQGAIKTMAEDILALRDTPDKLDALGVVMQSNFQRYGSTAWEYAKNGYINLLLARPTTWIKNGLGNTVAAANAITERTVGGLFSIDPKAGIAGTQEGFYLAKGMVHGIGDGFHAFAKGFGKITADDVRLFEMSPERIPGVAGRIMNFPGDLLRGMDNFFKAVLRRGSYYASAYRDGVHQGRAGDDLADFIARRVNHPVKTMIDEGDAFALYNTYQNQLGTLGTYANKALKTGPLVLWFPFMRTPINLAKYAWNRTPGLQLLSKSLYDDIAEGGVKADMAIGRLTMSTLWGHFLYHQTIEGNLTGGPPADPQLKAAWLLTHQPYSVKTPDGWRPMSGLEPASTTAAVMADFAQVMNQLDEPTAAQTAMAVTLAGVRDFVDKSYWRTVSDITSLGEKTEQGAPGMGTKLGKIALAPAVTALTGGALGSALTKFLDPVMRDTRTIATWAQSRVPGWSKDVPPLRNAVGNKVLPPISIGGPWLGLIVDNPLMLKPEEQDRVSKEMARLEVKVPYFPSNIGGSTKDDFDIREANPEDGLGVGLTPQQRDRWQVIYKNFIRHAEAGVEKNLLDTERYTGTADTPVPRALQREMLTSYLSNARTYARDALMAEDPDLAMKVMQSTADKVKPLLDPAGQERVQQQTEATMELYLNKAPEARDNLLKYGVLDKEPQ